MPNRNIFLAIVMMVYLSGCASTGPGTAPNDVNSIHEPVPYITAGLPAVPAHQPEQPVQPVTPNNSGYRPVPRRPLGTVLGNGITLRSPDRAENGAVVPVSINGINLGKNEQIELLANLCPAVKVTNTGQRTIRSFSSRVKMVSGQGKLTVKLNGSPLGDGKQLDIKIGDEPCQRFRGYDESGFYPTEGSVDQAMRRRSSIRARGKYANGTTTIKTLISHPMETGTRRDRRTNEILSPLYITDLVFIINGETVAALKISPAVSKNPYFSLEVDGGNRGDSYTIAWRDNIGMSDAITATLR
ncbi:MAG: thiosulfate oxidation carrier complex protein SoxZ [Gammaproteobacteria bacterium]|nr:thiosulfate oxidation carrier complex protein SoxZ [Gammaproteobacteria bacterium]MDH5652710.1 thiosulfate oxidation carrier complex protein SoxZ [Gammaproteobacteria bacterium]